MERHDMHRLAGFFLSLVILCGSAHAPALAEDKTLTVFAAASMKNALDDIDVAFTAKTGVKVNASYAASSTLAKQIEQGAPADVFVSADTDWMDYAVGKKTINEPTRVNLLGNSIVLIAPKDSKIDTVTIGPGFDLAKLGGDGGAREIRLHVSDPPDLLTCLRLHRRNGRRSSFRCGSPRSQRWSRRRSASRWRGCWRGGISGVSRWSMRWFTCRWCYRRSSPAISCC